jgi:hypothetical protein
MMFIWLSLTAIIYLLIIRHLWWDAVYPIWENALLIIENNYKSLWRQDILWTVNILDKVRWLSTFVFSFFNLFSVYIYLISFSMVGFLSFYFLLKLISSQKNIIPNNTLEYAYVLLSVFFVVNPLVIAHIPHYYILQGYFIYPLLVFLYIKHVINSSYINWYFLFFPLVVLLLGQPHNYYNWFVILLFLFLFLSYVSFKNNRFFDFFKRNLFLLLYVCLFLGPLIGSFIVSIPNDLTSSTSSFAGSEPNMIWSSSQGIINTLVFKVDFFIDYHLLMFIFLGINSFLLIKLFFLKELLVYKKYVLLFFIIIISLTFIAKNPFFSSLKTREIVYKSIPHLRVDVSYIVLIFIFIFILWIWYSLLIDKKKWFIKATIAALIIQLSITTLIGYSYFIDKENIINQVTFFDFTNWIDNTIKTTDPVLIQPISVTYLVPGLSQSIYPSLFIKNNPALHWLFMEWTLLDTIKFVKQNPNLLDVSFLQKTSLRYIFCFPDWCSNINTNKNFKLLWKYGLYEIYEFISYNPILVTKNILYKMYNPSYYQLNITLPSNQSIIFLQSFHPAWKLYLESYSSIDCQDPSRYLDNNLTDKLNNHSLINIDSINFNQVSKNKPTLEINHTKECKSENRFYAWGELSKLWRKPIFDNTHTMVYDYANQWTIDPEYIRANYSKDYYKENPDGSIDVRMTLYFLPQSYFYLWLIISGVTFFGCISYLLVSSIRVWRVKRKLDNESDFIEN